jgi:hypothetical protein
MAKKYIQNDIDSPVISAVKPTEYTGFLGRRSKKGKYALLIATWLATFSCSFSKQTIYDPRDMETSAKTEKIERKSTKSPLVENWAIGAPSDQNVTITTEKIDPKTGEKTTTKFELKNDSKDKRPIYPFPGYHPYYYPPSYYYTPLSINSL